MDSGGKTSSAAALILQKWETLRVCWVRKLNGFFWIGEGRKEMGELGGEDELCM